MHMCLSGTYEKSICKHFKTPFFMNWRQVFENFSFEGKEIRPEGILIIVKRGVVDFKVFN